MLAAPTYEGITFHATGPVSVTQEQLAEAASGAAGVPIAFKPLTGQEATAGLTAAGLPPFLVDVLSRFQQAGSEGAFDLVSGDIARLTGRPAQAATDFVTEALRAQH